MKSKVVVAEKPSVAKDIAAFLGAKTRHDGYFEGNGYFVTWAFGHLVTLKDPDEYDPSLKKWSLHTLPFIPETFQLKLVSNPGVSKQFAIIKRLFKQSSELICATDAGREGELIFRYILSYAGLEKTPFKRLWLSSLTDEAMEKAFAQLRPSSDFDCLYAAARCRSESDWIVGLNATRNFTVRYGRGEILWSVGRVQTPVLALIVGRDEEIRSFISKPFWELKTSYRNVEFKAKKERFLLKEKGEDLLSIVQDRPFMVEKVESKEEKSFAPSLYDLTDLQREMNKKYGMSASDTLQVAQTLYESKLISYPRTDSKFLGSDMKKEVVAILSSLKPFQEEAIAKLDLKALAFTSRVINDQKTGEHHAIIPTGKLPSATLPLNSFRVFEAIALRLIAVFYPPCLKEVTTIEGRVESILFQAKGIRVIDPSWTLLFAKKQEKEEKSDEEQELPSFVVGESGPHAPFLKEGKTEPPKHYTEATLLSAMETAGKFVEDEQLAEALKQKGLGTPATRASIIETLLKRGYILREKKSLVATSLGRYLIALIQDPNLKSPELTGEWECKLKEIEQGKLDFVSFMQEIVAYTKSTCKDGFKIDLAQMGPCPFCHSPVIQGKTGFGCSNWKSGCSFVIKREYRGISLTQEMIRSLIQQKVIPQPLKIEDKEVVLYMSAKGALMEIPLEVKNNKPKKYQKR